MLKISFHEKKLLLSMSNFKLLIVKKLPFERIMIKKKKKNCVVEFFLTKQASLLALGREVSTIQGIVYIAL